MRRITTATRAVDLFGVGKSGFKDGNLGLGVAPTDFNADWPNQIQEEIANVIEAAGITLNGADLTQLVQAIRLVTPGRLLRTTVYKRVAGVQNVSVDGGANTTVGASTFTPIAGMKFAIVEAQGGGSGGAGAIGAGVGNVSMGGPGACGSYGMSRYDAATIGASQAVVVGLGSAGSSGAVGGTTSLGSLLTAPGGSAAGALVNQAPPSFNGTGGAAPAPTGANLVSIQGISPFVSVGLSASAGYGGAGGSSPFGQGAPGPAINTTGVAAVNPGSGGSGTVVNQAGGTAQGGAGAAGLLIVREYA